MKSSNGTFGKSLHNNPWVLYLLWLPLVITATLWIALNYQLGIIITICSLLIVISWIVSYLNLQYLLLLIISVVLPFSVEIPVNDSLNVNFPSEPLLALTIFSMGWDIMRKPGLIKQFTNYENRWVLAFLMCFAVTTFFSSMPIVSIKFSIVNVTYALVFFVWLKYLLFMKPGIFQRIMGLFSLSLIVVLVFSLIQFHRFDWDPVTIRGIFRPFYKDNTIFGATSALIASFWLAYALKTNSLVSKVLYLSLGMVFLAGVVLSTSRAAVLSLIFFIIILTILLLRVRLKYVVMGIIISLFIGNLFRNQIFEFLKKDKHMSHSTQFGYVEQLESSGNISTDVSNIERLNRWVAGWQMYAKKPITGFGPGTYQFAYIPYQKKEFMSRLTVKDPWHIPENSGGTAHSEYLLALSEMGLFGIIVLLALLGRWTWIAFVKARNHPLRVNIIIGFAVLSTYFFHAFFNNFLSTDKFAFLFWGTAAWMASQMELKPNEQIRL